MQKKRAKKIISWLLIGLLVVGLAVMPLLAGSEEVTDGPQASVLSAEVRLGNIDTLLIGGGTLAGEDAVDITIPASVMLTELLVSNGDTVVEGDAVAAVDRVTVMLAIAEVQETLELIREDIEDISSDVITDEITAQAGGMVKFIYAEPGDSVQDVMLEHGALAVLSLDGLMKVEIQRATGLEAGDSVCVTLSDGTEVVGRVESNYGGVLTVTFNDEGYAVGESVTVTTDDGGRVGTGTMEIHSPWNAVGYSGTVAKVKVSEGKTVSSGTVLMTLEDTGHTAEYARLSVKHREYEELMLELFRMYQSERITAPSDGVITGLDENSANLLADSGSGWCISLLTNAPSGDDETSYTNFVAQVVEVGIDGLILRVNPQRLDITDYLDLSGVPTDTELMTEDAICSFHAPIYEYADGAWVQIDASVIAAEDILLFAGDESGSIVWAVRIGKGSPGEEAPEETQPADPSESGGTGDNGDTPTTETPGDSTGSDNAASDSGSIPDNSSGSASGGQFSGGSYGGYSGFGGIIQEETGEEYYSMDTVTIASVLPQESMTLEITVDEQDVGKVYIGQAAQVMLDALTGEFFDAVVTQIGSSGTNNGGSSKFAVELTLARSTNMLAGMNAAAYITLDTAFQVLTVPVAALQDDGSETILYTSYDEETGTCGDPVAVTVGVSDGETAQILSGIEEGVTCYYPYYDTLVTSDSVESGRFSFGTGSGSGRGGR